MIQPYEDEEPEYEEQCRCGHSPAQHRWIRNQYRRPDTFPCDECNCYDYEEAAKNETS